MFKKIIHRKKATSNGVKKKNNYYFYDLHTHTKASGDAISSVKDYIKLAKKRRLTGFAITDHDKVYKGKQDEGKDSSSTRALARGEDEDKSSSSPLSETRVIKGITIIPGTEITLKDGSHILAYYIKEPLPKDKLTLIEAVKLIKKQGGYCFLAHPMNIIGGYFKSGGYFKIKRRKIEEIRDALNIVDGIELGNARESSHLRNLTKKIVRQAIPGTKKIIYSAGSDSHTPNSLGLGIIKTKEPLTRENFLRVMGDGDIIMKTNLDFVRRILYLIEQLFVTIIKITFLYNNKIARKIFYKIFFHTYLKTKLFVSKKRNKIFNFEKEHL